MGGRRVRVFHISDLHMRTIEGPQAGRVRLEAASRWRVLGEKWTANLAELRRDGVPFDLVVFTGDLGDWGHPTDYPRAFAFLKEACAALAVPLDRLFVIPGNHDIDRKAQAAAWRWVRKNIGADPRAYSEWMAGGGTRDLRRNDRRDKILERQQAFWAAVTKELGRSELLPSYSPHKRLGYRQAVTLPGLSQPIQVIGLDTAWLAGNNDDSGALRLTEHQVSLLTTAEDGAPLPGFRLALMHHRLADLADAADARRHMAERVDLLLHGHQHEPTADVVQGPDHQLLVLATGCLYEGDAGHRYPNACQVIDLELDDQARPQGAQVRFRGWSERGLFWGDDALLYRNAREGRLRLDRGARGWRFDEADEGADEGQQHRPGLAGATRTPVSPLPLPSKSPGLIDFTAERARHAQFVGRAALLARLDQLLLADRDDRWVVVTGGPGMGKSALLSAWLAQREAAGAAVPHHFIRRGEYDWDDPVKLVGSLVAQLAERFPDQCEPEADARMHPAARLEAALRRVSENELARSGERLVVLIDGLDEYDPPNGDRGGAPGRDPLAAFLPRTLPRGMSLLCASRPRHPYVDMLTARGAVQLDLDNEGDFVADNTATVRAFWEQAGPGLGLDATFIAEAVACAGGNLQHAAMLRLHLAGLPAEQRRVEAIPRGLAALLASAWERIATDPVVVEGLGILCAAREALTLDELGAVAGWTGEAPRRVFLRGARELLIERRREGAVIEYRLHHDSIRGQIAESIGPAALCGHHSALAQKLAMWPISAEATAMARRYALRHALTHRAEAGEWADAWRLAADMGFVEAKCRELGAHDAEADLARAAERSPASGDEALCRRFDDLARALGRESHWLRTAPEATVALVWNRLRQLGWSADEVDQQLHVPPGATFLRLRHLATRESPALVRDLVGHSRSVLACTVTPNGRRVVSASGDKTLKVWDLESGRPLATLDGHTGRVTACAVTPDGQRVVSASDDHTLKVWDLESGRPLATLDGHTGRVTACAVTPDGQRVVSASDDHTLKIWDVESGRPLATLDGHAAWVTACAVTADGQRVVSASDDHTLKVWDLESGRPLATLDGHTSFVTACAMTPDGRRVVSASHDHTLKVWDLASGRPGLTLDGHTARVNACAVTPDGRRVVSASDDSTLKVWDLASGRPLTTLDGHTSFVTACAMTPDGRRVVSASDDSTLKVWDLASGRPLATLDSHASFVNAFAMTPDGHRMVSASDDHTLKVWDLASGRPLATLDGHVSRVNACAVTRDGRRVVSASADKTLKVWDLASRRPLTTLQAHAASVTACAVTPDGRRVVSASDDHTLKVWDLASGRPLATLDGHTSFVTACAVTPDGRRVVSASSDKTLKIWDLASRRLLATLDGHAAWVHACAVTPDGRRVVSASSDKTLKVWDLASGRLLATLDGHTAWVHACAVTPDGRRVVSTSADKTLKVWDLESGTCFLTHCANTGYLAVTATATAIIAGGAVGAVWFLDWPSPKSPREFEPRRSQP